VHTSNGELRLSPVNQTSPLPRRLSEDSLLEKAEVGRGDNEARNSFKKSLHFLDLCGFLAQEQLKLTAILESG
jgi:hypothetical protein